MNQFWLKKTLLTSELRGTLKINVDFVCKSLNTQSQTVHMNLEYFGTTICRQIYSHIIGTCHVSQR